MTAFEWDIRVRIDDATAITIGRTVAANGDAATADECRLAFAMALPQFMARAMAERYSLALAARAVVHANDLASAVVTSYPEGYDPTQFVPVLTEPRDPPGPPAEFATGPAADPFFRSDAVISADLSGAGDVAAAPMG